MRKVLFLALLMTVFVFAAAYAESACAAGATGGSGSAVARDSDSGREPPRLIAEGFAFKGKDFKTIRVIVFEEKKDKKSDNSTDKEGGAAPDKRDGNLWLAGFEYALKIVSFEEGKLAADLFRSSDFETSKDKKEQKQSLPVPVGHIAIDRSQPNPGSVVFLGSLRLNDEETKIDGEFDLYLNDHTPQKR
ncbi:MAG: hypothetical protein KKB51_13455 [Candidatus Riflebacteria bacterium]|nr:hypothetical protein [Candidatus Riflebacteria bacterium]